MLITPLGLRIIVRFARKPIWMPTAPSKLFRITNHTFYDSAEMVEIKKLNHAYTAQMESIAKFMEKEFYIPATQAGGMPKDFLEKEMVEDEKLYEENDKINVEVAKQKEKFLQDRLNELESKVMEEKLAIEEALIEAGHKMDEYIKKVKSDPLSCVTRDNIEAQIVRAMENPVNFEYYIDKQGRKIVAGQPGQRATATSSSSA